MLAILIVNFLIFPIYTITAQTGADDLKQELTEKQKRIDALQEKINEYNKNGNVLWPMRVALSGQEKSPSPFEIAEVLGKDKTLKRLKNAISKL